MKNSRKYSFMAASIGLAMAVGVEANEDIKYKKDVKEKVDTILTTSYVVVNNPNTNIEEILATKNLNEYKEESDKTSKFLISKLKENKDAEEVIRLLDKITEYANAGIDTKKEWTKIENIYSKNYHSEIINYILGKYLFDNKQGAEDIKGYFLRSLQGGNKYKEDIINGYVGYAINYIKEDPKRMDDGFVATMILDFLPHMSQEFILNSGLDKKIIDNLLLLKEFKHNLSIIDKSEVSLIHVDFIEQKVMAMYKENQNNIDINYIMGDYMLKHKMFSAKMRECLKKALTGNKKYFEAVHTIFLSKIVDLIKEDHDAINNEAYADTINEFLPFISKDLEEHGIKITKK